MNIKCDKLMINLLHNGMDMNIFHLFALTYSDNPFSVLDVSTRNKIKKGFVAFLFEYRLKRPNIQR